MKYKKSKYKISAKLIKKGSCPYYEEGLTFQLTGFTPNGLCDSAYAVISRDELALRLGMGAGRNEHNVLFFRIKGI